MKAKLPASASASPTSPTSIASRPTCMRLETVWPLAFALGMAHMISTALIRRLREMKAAGPQEPEAEQAEAEQAEAPAREGGAYQPTPMDIAVTRIMLVRSTGLPPDLVDAIFDEAEFWAHSTTAMDFGSEHQAHLHISGAGPQENRFLVRAFPLGLTGIGGDVAEELAYDTSEAQPRPLGGEHEARFFARLAPYPTPRLARPCRKIVFSMRSRDQGWGGESRHRGTYRGSWTWFEAGLERFDAGQECDAKCTYDVRHESARSTAPALAVCALRPVQPEVDNGQYSHPLLPREELTICRNKTATREWQDHVVTWSYRDDTGAETEGGQRLEEAGRGRGTGDGAFVRGLRLGDVVTVWGKARFPAWANSVERLRIDVYWAV